MKMAFDTHKIPTTRTFIPIPYISSNIDKPNSLQLLSNIHLTASKIPCDKPKISTIQNHRTSYFHYRAEREKKLFFFLSNNKTVASHTRASRAPNEIGVPLQRR